jgi:hypothetical protein
MNYPCEIRKSDSKCVNTLPTPSVVGPASLEALFVAQTSSRSGMSNSNSCVGRKINLISKNFISGPDSIRYFLILHFLPLFFILLSQKILMVPFW